MLLNLYICAFLYYSQIWAASFLIHNRFILFTVTGAVSCNFLSKILILCNNFIKKYILCIMEWKYIKNKNSYGTKISLNDNLISFVRAQVSSFYLVAVWIFAENPNLEAQKIYSRMSTSSKNTTIWPVHSPDSLSTLLSIGLYWFTGHSGHQTAIFLTILSQSATDSVKIT